MEFEKEIECIKITDKRPWLVDLPVRINIWIRPECQRAQFEVIKRVCPSIIFLQSDGGRNEQEWEAIYSNRNIFNQEIDWNCTVYKIFADYNHGLYAMAKIVTDFIWSKVDRCLFLEDDQIPSVSCFSYHAELLEKYKNDLRIECICSFNPLGVYEKCTTDYLFSRQGSIWGSSYWRDRFVNRQKDFKNANDPYVLFLLKQRTRHNKIAWNRLNAYLVNEKYEGHVAGSEFYVEFAMYGHNRVQIVPQKNLLSYRGDTSNSAHASENRFLPKSVRKIYGTKAYELEFPLIHPSFVIPDISFEIKRNRIIGHNTPIISFFRRIETTYYYIRAGKMAIAYKKAIARLKGNRNEK